MLAPKKLFNNWILRILVIQFVGLLIVGIFTLRGNLSTHDLSLYYKSSLYLIEGKLPYRDFALEYPPFALVAFAIPRIFTLGLTNNYYIYAFFFLLENIVFSTINMLLMLKLMSSYSQRKKIIALAFYTLFALCIAPVMLWRYDLFPTVLTVLGLVSVISTRPTEAGISLGFGIAAKLYPVILLPIFTVYYLANKAHRALLNLWIGTIGTVGLILLPFFIVTHERLFSFLSYHKARGLQIESFFAGIIAFGHRWGLIEAKTVASYGSRDIVSPLSNTVLHLLPWFFIVIYGVMLINCFYRFRQERFTSELVKSNSLIIYTMLALLIFIITNKVFSPQYLVWIIPLAALLNLRQAFLMLAVCITTYIMLSVGSFRQLDYAKVLWLNLRNFLILGLSIWVFLDNRPHINLRANSQRLTRTEI
ncbi:glycosyltransferase 87 family protein [Iningainema tapete]|uniref:DUF2029 domain-containing protein n=1 Tax=Iningainema tapete BLCC-T55 TaxID=2748662 RepID=A0A8J6XKM4_9CYAN|nr:glycosyltransferase 87 family protein [Iningainema tapete]MBD2776423.1 DUF2029 domain-containing protein [Iningainema tapete BLCC-T55]